MRTTKAILLAAAVAAGGFVSATAQVTSVNVVGFYNITLTNIGGFATYYLLANQLTTAGGPGGVSGWSYKGDNSLNACIPTAPSGDQILIWNYAANPAGWVTRYEYFDTGDADSGWYNSATGDPGTNAGVLNPGKAFFYLKGAGSPATLTFVGEVLQATATSNLTQRFEWPGYTMTGSLVPQNLPFFGATANDNLGFPRVPGLRYAQWDVPRQAFNSGDPAGPRFGFAEYFDTGGPDSGFYDSTTGNPVLPTPAIGEGFAIIGSGATQADVLANPWVRNFTVQ